MNKIKTIRKQSKRPQKEVARALGVSRATLWNYETGRRKLTFETAVKLAKIYGCSVADFADGVESYEGETKQGKRAN